MKQKTLLIIFPHPDDESVMTGGLIQHKLKRGWRVVVAILTRGERGQIHINGRGKSLASIRESEFLSAMKQLGIEEYRLFEYPDAGLRRNGKWKREVSRVLDEVTPSLVVTYDHSGFTGHPDHIALSVELLKQVRKREGVRLWWVSKEASPIRIALSLVQVVRKMRAILQHKSQGLWKNPVIWWWLLSGVEYFSEVDLSKRYSHRYSEFRI